MAPVNIKWLVPNNYLYISGFSVVGLSIVGYLLYNKLKKPKQNLIDVPPPSNVGYANTKIEPKRDIFEMCLKLSITYIYIYMVEKYMKDFKESIYHGAVISALAVGFTMFGPISRYV